MPALDAEEAWLLFEQGAEEIVRACERDMQTLAPASMVLPGHLGRLRGLTIETAERLGVPEAQIADRVAPVRDRLVKLCGL